MCDRLERDSQSVRLFDKMISSAPSILKLPGEADFDRDQTLELIACRRGSDRSPHGIMHSRRAASKDWHFRIFRWLHQM
jgi:hypothetical protein